METLKQSLSKYIDQRIQSTGKMPSDEEIVDFKKRYKKYYLKEYSKNYRKKNTPLKIILNPDQEKQFKKYCGQFKKKKSTLAKEIILNHINNENILTDSAEKKLRETIIQLRKIGNNINQLTNLAHEYKDPAYENSFSQALIQLEKLEIIIIDNIVKNDNKITQ